MARQPRMALTPNVILELSDQHQWYTRTAAFRMLATGAVLLFSYLFIV
jgi:hypothetical protein